jgi:hypothetical protein
MSQWDLITFASSVYRVGRPQLPPTWTAVFRAGVLARLLPSPLTVTPLPRVPPPGGLSDLALAGRIKHTVCRVGF